MSANIDNVVLSARVRLARNYEDLPFPTMQNDQQAQDTITRTASAIARSDMSRDFELIFLKNNSESDNLALVEAHLISPDLIRNRENAAVLLNGEKTISIMVGEEDDVRIQAILTGFSVRKAYELAGRVDDCISKGERYAFDPQLGYLTACPTNTGTGMRASLMLHLPALTLTHQIEPLSRALATQGMTVRGFYGEGSKALGSIYQMSNQITLGRSEEEIIRLLESTASQIIDREMHARQAIYKANGVALKDRLLRSFGVLLWAAKLDSGELINLWSDLRFAISLDIVTGVSARTADRLLDLQPFELNKLAQKEMTSQERDIYRAQCVKDILKNE